MLKIHALNDEYGAFNLHSIVPVKCEEEEREEKVQQQILPRMIVFVQHLLMQFVVCG